MIDRLRYFPRCVALIALVGMSFGLEAQTNEEKLPAGVKLAHFAELDRNVYVGSKPHSDADFAFLQSKNVHTILSARFWPFFSERERNKAKRYGMTLISHTMNASPIPPSEKHVDEILLTLREKQLQPVYLHCVLGRDRTSLIAGLYRIYFLGVPQREAYAEMKRSGFPSWFGVLGLKLYFDKHSSTKPPALKRQSSSTLAGGAPAGFGFITLPLPVATPGLLTWFKPVPNLERPLIARLHDLSIELVFPV